MEGKRVEDAESTCDQNAQSHKGAAEIPLIKDDAPLLPLALKELLVEGSCMSFAKPREGMEKFSWACSPDGEIQVRLTTGRMVLINSWLAHQNANPPVHKRRRIVMYRKPLRVVTRESVTIRFREYNFEILLRYLASLLVASITCRVVSTMSSLAQTRMFRHHLPLRMVSHLCLSRYRQRRDRL